MRYTVKDEDFEIVFESDSPRKVIAFLKRHLRSEVGFDMVHDAKTGVELGILMAKGKLIISPREHDRLDTEVDMEVSFFVDQSTRPRLFAKVFNAQARRMNSAQRALSQAAVSLRTPLNTEIIDLIDVPTTKDPAGPPEEEESEFSPSAETRQHFQRIIDSEKENS